MVLHDTKTTSNMNQKMAHILPAKLMGENSKLKSLKLYVRKARYFDHIYLLFCVKFPPFSRQYLSDPKRSFCRTAQHIQQL